MGVALFDLLPEALRLVGTTYSAATVTLWVAIGFFAFMFLNRVVLMHPHEAEEHEGHHHRRGIVGATSLTLHSFLDGVGIGLAFQVSAAVGLIVAAAVLAHDFSDGINTVNVVVRHGGKKANALRWLL